MAQIRVSVAMTIGSLTRQTAPLKAPKAPNGPLGKETKPEEAKAKAKDKKDKKDTFSADNAPRSVAPDTLTESPPQPNTVPKTLSQKALSLWRVPASGLVKRLPKPLVQYAEQKIIFPGSSSRERKKAPDLEKLKQAYLTIMGEELFFTTIGRIQEVSFVSQQDSKTLSHRAWFVPPKDGMPTILASSPNQGNLGEILDLETFTASGYGALTYEYPGYGKTGGKPTEAGLYRSVEAASDYLSQQQHIPVGQQIGYGVSLGGAVTAHLAAQRPLKGVILESTFTSVPETMLRLLQKHIHPGMTGAKLSKKLRYQFDSVNKIDRIQCPLLILHGNEDPLLPVDFAQSLYQKATSPQKTLRLIESKSHILPSTAINASFLEFLNDLQHEPQHDSGVQGSAP